MVRRGERFAVRLEQPRYLIQSFSVIRGDFAARAHHGPDQPKCDAPRFRVRRQHGRDGGKRGVGIEEQDIELLTHQRLEGGKRQVAVRLSNAPDGLKSTFVDRPSAHAGIEQSADNRRAQSADRNASFQLGNSLAEELAM